ncbi:MAG TPA: hypothetical protein VGB53_15440 [Rubricoccaceae bacterium]|jgi:uncharacterized protein (TIGR02588 family)
MTTPNPRNGVENAVFSVSLVLVLALVGALASEAIRGPAGPAHVQASVLQPVQRSGSAIATVTIRNTGGTAAEAVRVEACGRGGPAGETICAEAEVPYVPAGATRSAVVGFAKAPGGPLRARVVSYLEP